MTGRPAARGTPALQHGSPPCRRLLAGLAAAVLAGLSGPGWAAGAHQHGVASLQVVAEGSSLSIRLDSPLDNLLGFERAPRSAAERAAVQAMAQRWHAGAALARPTPAAGCVLQGVELQSAALAPALLAPAAASLATGPATVVTAAAPAQDVHADLQATLRFVCSAPQALKGVALDGLFAAFARLRQLDAVLVAPGTQRGRKLLPGQPLLAW